MTAQDGTKIEGKRITLRDKCLADAANDYAWRADLELVALDAARPFKLSFKEYAAIYEEELNYPGFRERRFAIEENTNGKHIGNCMYYNLDNKNSEVELGIIIGDRDYWERGYGSDTVSTLVKYIFEQMSVDRIYLYTLDWNIRAQKCFEKCGFVACGRSSRDGNNFIVMELKQDWPRRKG